MRMQKRLLALTLVVMFMAVNTLSIFAQLSDTSGHWASSAIEKWSTDKIVTGYPDGSYKPDNAITRAEFAIILDRIFAFVAGQTAFSDVKQGSWYEGAVNKVFSAGIVKGYSDGTFKPEAQITRQEAAVMLSTAFELTPASAQSSFSDSASIATWALSGVSALAEKGYIKGRAGNQFDPTAKITRAEAVTIINQIVGAFINEGKTFSTNVTGNLLINAADVTLKDMTISGNLYIAPGVGTGKVTLDNVTVQGNIIKGTAEVITVNGTPTATPTATATPAIGAVTSITLNKLATNIEVGKSKLLIATVLPSDATNKKVIWSTSDAAVATVSQTGTVTAVSLGSADITAKSESNPEISITSRVTAIAEALPIKSFTFDTAADAEGWSIYGTYPEASVMAETVVHNSTDLGNGTLKINIDISKATDNWQEVKIAKDVAELSAATMVTYDLYIDMSTVGNYTSNLLSPYMFFEPGILKSGLGQNSQKINALETVVHNGKTFAVMHVKIPYTAVADKTKLVLCYVSSGMVYQGDIYIDNVKLLDASTIAAPEPNILPDNSQPVISTTGFAPITVQMVDNSASNTTKSLFAYMKGVQGKNILFGQQHATTQGMTTGGSVDGTQSDVNNAVGTFPAVYGWDTLSLIGDEEPFNLADTQKVMKLAYERGGIITLSSHTKNFVTGGSYTDTSGKVVSQILPGGSKNADFNAFLDMIANFANTLKDDQQNLIPVIFRPFHENTGDWFWWGAPYCTKDEYKNLFRYTVEYLRDVKGVHNFLYAYSPMTPGTEDNYLNRYPGDEYIDIIGFDSYDSAYSQGWKDTLTKDAALVAKLAAARGKISAITEFGYNDMKATGNTDPTWFTKVINTLKNDPDAKNVSYMLTWRNGALDEFYVPFRNHLVYGNSDMLDDFIAFYNDSYTGFNNNLNGVYTITDVTTTKTPFAYITSPLSGSAGAGTTIIKAKVLNYGKTIDRVVYSTKVGEVTATNEASMTLNGSEYEASWTPSGTELEASVKIVLKVYFTDASTVEDSLTVSTVAEVAVVDTSVVDTFDTYAGDNALMGEAYTSNGIAPVMTLVERDGGYALKYDYSLNGSGSYGGRIKVMESDWSAYDRLSLWITPDGQNQKLVIQIKANGIYFETYPSLAGTEAGVIEIPFDTFAPAPWDNANAGRTFDAESRSVVQSYAMYVNADGLTIPSGGTLLFDDIRATGTAGAVTPGTSTGVVTNFPTTTYDFESSTDGWGGQANWVTDLTTSISEDWASTGTKSLKAIIAGTDPTYSFHINQNEDLTGKTSIKMDVRASSDGISAKPFIKTGGAWTWADGGDTALTKDTAATLTIPLAGVSDVNAIKAIGVQFTGATGETSVYVDNIRVE